MLIMLAPTIFSMMHFLISTRYDMVKLYESPDFYTDATELTFTIMETAALNFIYYIEVPYSPNPTPSAIPISIRMDQMTQTGEVTCYTTSCPDTNLDSPSAYQCGVKCSSKSGSFSYSFTGVKFGIIGNSRRSNYETILCRKSLYVDNS